MVDPDPELLDHLRAGLADLYDACGHDDQVFVEELNALLPDDVIVFGDYT